MKRTVPLLALVSWLLPGASAAQASLVFNFNFTDPSGSGFNDATLGPTRQAALESAASTLAGYFNVAGNVTVTIDAGSGGSGNTLASAGSPIPLANGFQPTVVQDKILTGTDLNGSAADGTMLVNFTQPWFYGNTPVSGSYDFQSVAMHELTHTLGFISEISSTGQGAANQTSGSPDVWSTFDRFLTDSAGNPLVNPSTFAFDTSKLGVLTGGPGSGGMFFSGPNAVAAFGGRVAIFSPNPWQQGSSGSHIDGGPGGYINEAFLMDPSVSSGLGLRALTTTEQGFLRDLGYSVVPEPAATGLISAVGLLLCAAAHRRLRA